RFSDVPTNHHPAAIFPEVRSVIVIGKRITRGALRGIEEGTQFDLYFQFGRDWLNNRVLALASFRSAEFLENNGWEAVPLPNLPPEVPPMGLPVKEGLPAPNVMMDFDDAAVRAGLGEIGYCNLFLTPEFGPRQRLQIILTDAELEPTPMLTKAICTRCMDHTKFCPLGAISKEGERTLTIAGKEMVVGNIDYAKCAQCKNGAFGNALHSSGKPDRMAALCTRNCIQFLEENEQISNTFQNPFRTREPWGVIEERKTL
ncbi:MAG TPA: hypothetical protein VHR86_01225, partial [Armatimonadota bacterium]|nr:hypothetical protein [Armatimonadota bacterium]